MFKYAFENGCPINNDSNFFKCSEDEGICFKAI